jgi:HK97 family phage major capsid protein
MAVDLKPTEAMANEAERGLAWREEFGRGGTEVGVARARDIKNRANLSPETVRRMVSYFARHEVDKEAEGFSPGEEGYPSAGRIAWALWGGDPGKSWAARKSEELDREDEERTMDKVEKRHIVAVVEDEATVTVTFAKSEFDMDESEAADEAIEALEDEREEDDEEKEDREEDEDEEKEDREEDEDEKPYARLTEDELEDIKEAIKEELSEAIESAVEDAIEETLQGMGEMSRPVDAEGKEPDEEGYLGPAARKGPKERVFRSATFERATIEEQSRRATLAFSSEMEVDRGWGIEILDHSEDAIDAEFIGSGRAPLLVDHDMADQVGVVEQINLGADRVARAVVRFGKSARAEEIWQDVKDGIRSNVSVGYVINEMVSDGKQGDREVFRATRWSPLEISIVSIPADTSVGVGRSLDADPIIFVKESKKMADVNSVRSDAAKAERERVSAILELASRHNQREFGEKAIRDGVSIEQFRGSLLDKVGSKPLSVNNEVGLSDKEVRAFSFVRAIRALSNPQDRRAQEEAAFEFEASRAAAAKEGRDSRGIMIPADVLYRDLTTGVATNTAKAGNTVATDLLAERFIDVLRNKMVLNTLGAQFLTGLQGNIAIPRKTAASDVYWVGENVAPTESTNKPSFDQVTMSPKTLAGYVDYSRRLMLQSSLDIEALVRNDLATTIAVAMDGAAIAGSGTNRPTGVLNTSGIGSVTLGTNGGAPTWGMVTNLVKEVEIDNALTGSASFLTNGQVKARLASLPRQGSGVEGNFILGPDMNNLYGFPIVVSQQVPANLSKGNQTAKLGAMIFGVWSDLLVGQWSGIDLMADPYTGSNAGTVRIVAFHDCDFAVRHPESFAECNEITLS